MCAGMGKVAGRITRTTMHWNGGYCGQKSAYVPALAAVAGTAEGDRHMNILWLIPIIYGIYALLVGTAFVIFMLVWLRREDNR